MAHDLLKATRMSKPRQVLPGQFYSISRRCAQRQYLMRPDDETNNAWKYCVAEAANRFEIDVITTDPQPNHHHTNVFDRHGRYPSFLEHLHKMFARSQNALRGRWENFWSAEEPCVTRVLDRETVIAKIVYSITNPVKDGLVERVHHYPGVNGYKYLLSGKPLRARRPRHFFRSSGTMPETVELYLTIPPELGDRAEVLAEIRAGVERVEREAAEERKRTGKRVLGRRQILRRSWKDSPTSEAPRRNLRPRFAGQRENRLVALLEYRAFLEAYADARRRWLAKERAVFPVGTYWLARFAAVPVAEVVC
jgi:hypothetical protein